MFDNFDEPKIQVIEINSQINELYAKSIATQKVVNDSDKTIELKIYVYKHPNIIFNSFSVKIGDSVIVKSKVIKKEKAEEKYTDSISSGKGAIFVCDDPDNKNRILIHIGNIPPKEELIFTSEFMHFIEISDCYEFELFRNLPLFSFQNYSSKYSNIKGIVNINTKNKIKIIEKNIYSKELEIIEEKYNNECEYIIKYEMKKIYRNNQINDYDYKRLIEDDYHFHTSKEISRYYKNDNDNYQNNEINIPRCKIKFQIENNEPIVFYQKSTIKENESNYIVQYKNIKKEYDTESKIYLNPALFIFLIDQSYSMQNGGIYVAREALVLFLQSLPAKSYYQIIGYGSDYVKYNKEPLEYIQNNIKRSISSARGLRGDLGATNILSPLKDIYGSINEYKKLELPMNIFLLTDGYIGNNEKVLQLIEENSNEFKVYSIGIGEEFDYDLIKNAGIAGKGNYNFCPKLDNLKEIIANEISNACYSYGHDIKVSLDLNEKDLIKFNEDMQYLKQNTYTIVKYNIQNKEEMNNNKIKLILKHKYKKEEILENMEVMIEKLPEGDELSKLIMNQYLIENNKMNIEEKTKLALKYQLFTEYTSLFAVIEFSEKITEEMKKIIIGYKNNNEDFLIKEKSEKDKKISEILETIKKKEEEDRLEIELIKTSSRVGSACSELKTVSDVVKIEEPPKKNSASKFFKSLGNSIKGLFTKKNKTVNNNNINNDDIKKEEEKIDVNEIINQQNFVEGYWELNENTEIIKQQYEKQYKLLKDENYNDNIILTILIIYYIYKEHSELLKELIHIIQKGKNYIQKKTRKSYDDIIKMVKI